MVYSEQKLMPLYSVPTQTANSELYHSILNFCLSCWT